MRTIVKFKDVDVVLDCPVFSRLNDVELEAWKILRGTSIVLLGTIPEKIVDPEIRCGSDTYWQIEPSPEYKQSIALTGARYELYCACRHVLEIGD